ncbi:hypothetical protein ACS0TY_031819 [Phlomoides rotata]
MRSPTSSTEEKSDDSFENSPASTSSLEGYNYQLPPYSQPYGLNRPPSYSQQQGPTQLPSYPQPYGLNRPPTYSQQQGSQPYGHGHDRVIYNQSIHSYGPPPMQQHVALPHAYIQIPVEKVALFIGKGGETINYFEKEYGVSIEFTREYRHNFNHPNPLDKTFKLAGESPEKIETARNMIYAFLNQEGYNYQLPLYPQPYGLNRPPSYSQQQGPTQLPSYPQPYGLNWPPTYSQQQGSQPYGHGHDRVIYNQPITNAPPHLYGPPPMQQHVALPHAYIQIPVEKVALFIGKGGETINYFEKEYGVSIEFTREYRHNFNHPNPLDKTFKLTGESPEKIETARNMIYAFLNQGSYNYVQHQSASGHQQPAVYAPLTGRGSYPPT